MTRCGKAEAVPTSAAEVHGLVSWSDELGAAYQAARREIDQLQPGQAVVYHEGYLAINATHDATVAGRAAAFLQAGTELDQGALVQRRVGTNCYEYIFWRSGR